MITLYPVNYDVFGADDNATLASIGINGDKFLPKFKRADFETYNVNEPRKQYDIIYHAPAGDIAGIWMSEVSNNTTEPTSDNLKWRYMSSISEDDPIEIDGVLNSDIEEYDPNRIYVVDEYCYYGTSIYISVNNDNQGKIPTGGLGWDYVSELNIYRNVDGKLHSYTQGNGCMQLSFGAFEFVDTMGLFRMQAGAVHIRVTPFADQDSISYEQFYELSLGAQDGDLSDFFLGDIAYAESLVRYLSFNKDAWVTITLFGGSEIKLGHSFMGRFKYWGDTTYDEGIEQDLLHFGNETEYADGSVDLTKGNQASLFSFTFLVDRADRKRVTRELKFVRGMFVVFIIGNKIDEDDESMICFGYYKDTKIRDAGENDIEYSINLREIV